MAQVIADPKAVAARRNPASFNTEEARKAQAEAKKAAARAKQAQQWRKDHGLS
jgi:hypothetical protein